MDFVFSQIITIKYLKRTGWEETSLDPIVTFRKQEYTISFSSEYKCWLLTSDTDPSYSILMKRSNELEVYFN